MSFMPTDGGLLGAGTAGDLGLFGDPSMLALLGLGTGLLAGSQRSRTPVNLWAMGAQGAMQGIMLGQQAGQKRREWELQKQLKDLQVQKLDSQVKDTDEQDKKLLAGIMPFLTGGAGAVGGVAAGLP